MTAPMDRGDFDAGSADAVIGAGGNKNFDTLDDAFENSITREETLREHLNEQLHMAFDDPKDRMIGGLLIDSLDEAGYLRSSVSELSERLGCSVERIGRLLDTMKQFDPPACLPATSRNVWLSSSMNRTNLIRP
jgi:RNA polymerase sigma-54 factor